MSSEPAFTADERLAALRAVAASATTPGAALAQIARLRGELHLPRGAVHVISDVHGEDKKLRHIINNASGTLRPLVERMFRDRFTADELREFVTLLFYPAEIVAAMERDARACEQPQVSGSDVRVAGAEARRSPGTVSPGGVRTGASADSSPGHPDSQSGCPDRHWALRTIRAIFEVVRELAGRYSLARVRSVMPAEYVELFAELLLEPSSHRGAGYTEAIVDELIRRGHVLPAIHMACRVVRNLAIDELIIAGDCWDRGPRGDRVVDYLMRQPNVSIVWGNHDVAWLGAALGHEALICHVLRVSLRYRNLSQIEEGYGITMQPLEKLAREVYGSDAAEHFGGKGTGLRDAVTIARMQKAAAVMQFKLEGQMIARQPRWEMEHRRLLHRIDLEKGVIEVDGKVWPMRDTHLPTLNRADPYALTAEERACIERLRQSFVASAKLWEQVRFLVRHGSMVLRRDDLLIFHGCLPCDEKGGFLPMPIGDKLLAGRELFEEIERQVIAMLGNTRALQQRDLDLLWYLWSGPASPLFGKDRITTLESYFIADKSTHKETKNAYFSLLHEPWFCDQVLAQFGVPTATGLIVNGHVPVKIEQGESPMKRSGKAITIDGAFSKAYGDHGFTLLVEADRIELARHHHFDSVEAAVREGVDIVPAVTTIRRFEQPKLVKDTDLGTELVARIGLLEKLVQAYQTNRVRMGEE